MNERIDQWLLAFGLDSAIHEHVAMVVSNLPGEVRDDFMLDPAFLMGDYEPSPAAMQVSGRVGVGKRAGRSVVLKRTLRRRPVEFVRWVIAHELAHAHLRNGGRWPDDDPETAADSLAADWGFPRPTRLPWEG